MPLGKFPHDRAVFGFALLAGFPAVVLALIELWTRTLNSELQWGLSTLVITCWVGCSTAARNRVIRPLQTMANLLFALREEDYSFRARGARYGDALGDALTEMNELAAILQTQRRHAVEATALLRTVMAEVAVAVFAFDEQGTLRLVNRAGEKLLKLPADGLLGRSATSIGMSECLRGTPARILEPTAFPERSGRWGLRRSEFREGGRPHHLVVISDISEPLRQEELRAWRRLVRVLGHELNNSLAPIKSIAGTLRATLRREPRLADWESDMQAGLNIIATRAESLARFLQAYSKMARLPPPEIALCSLANLVDRVVALERRIPIGFGRGPAIDLFCDSAQVEQALINLIQNAVDAALERRAEFAEAGVRIRWKHSEAMAEIQVEDDGHGIVQTANLFVPFFTTKPEGSGIGLVLARQIAENHGGSLELSNRVGAMGCVATMRLPLNTSSAGRAASI